MEAEETGGRAPEGDYDPFEDGEFAECRKITPEDFCCLHPADRSLKGNRFLQYGFQAFGHLLLGKTGAGRFFWECREYTTSRKNSWRGCSVFPISNTAAISVRGKGEAATGTA